MKLLTIVSLVPGGGFQMLEVRSKQNSSRSQFLLSIQKRDFRLIGNHLLVREKGRVLISRLLRQNRPALALALVDQMKVRPLLVEG